MNALETKIRNKILENWEKDPELQVGVPYRRMATESAVIAAAELAALNAQLDALKREQAQEIDEFNAGYEAYKTDFDLDDAEQTYQNMMRVQGIPFHDTFATGYAWAKFVTERAALAQPESETK